MTPIAGDENNFQTLLLLNQLSAALDSVSTVITATKEVNFGEVAASEITEIEVLDEKEKPTGEKRPAAILTLKSGVEIELTPDEYKSFYRPYQNIRRKIDHLKFSLAAQTVNQLEASAQPQQI